MTSSSAASGEPSRIPLRLGLIGDHILESRSPALHRLAGRLHGFDITYDLLIPARAGKTFEEVFDGCRADGTRGVNITHPYKERVLSHLRADDAFIRSLGSVNTVVFEHHGAIGYNTDYSGFIAAYRAEFSDMEPGPVALVGAGGVGRAIAFALAALGASVIRVVDSDPAKADDLSESLNRMFAKRLSAETVADAVTAMAGARGVVNCTPMGMSGRPGSAVPAAALTGCRWGFDSVYTPVETQFKRDCESAGMRFLSGYELFFHQGVEAFRIFSDRAVTDLDLLKRILAE